MLGAWAEGGGGVTGGLSVTETVRSSLEIFLMDEEPSTRRPSCSRLTTREAAFAGLSQTTSKLFALKSRPGNEYPEFSMERPREMIWANCVAGPAATLGMVGRTRRDSGSER